MRTLNKLFADFRIVPFPGYKHTQNTLYKFVTLRYHTEKPKSKSKKKIKKKMSLLICATQIKNPLGFCSEQKRFVVSSPGGRA